MLASTPMLFSGSRVGSPTSKACVPACGPLANSSSIDGARALPLVQTVSPGTAVVVYTAFSTPEVAAELHTAGAAAVVTKTAKPSDLADVVFDCVEQRRLSQA